MPGSVEQKEAMNLYYGESYDSSGLLNASLRVFKSIGIGKTIGMYIEDPELMEWVKIILTRTFGSKHLDQNALKELKIHGPSELDKPHIILIKFLIWLYKYYDTCADGRVKNLLQNVLGRIKQTDIILYLTPGKDRVMYSTIPFPRLDIFFSNSMESAKRRNALISMRNTFYDLNRFGWSKGRKLQKILEVFTNKYEIVCHELLRSGYINHEVFRDMINIAIDLQKELNRIMTFSFIKDFSQ